MVLADQLLAAVPGNLAELVVHVGDTAGDVGGGDNRGAVECVFQIRELRVTAGHRYTEARAIRHIVDR